MDSITIKTCLRHLSRQSRTRPKVYVIAADEMSLVSYRSLPVVIVQNQDSSTEEGSHWILHWIEKPCPTQPPTLTFFCSFGTPLSSYNVEKPPFHLWAENRVRVQNPKSSTCGMHCIYVAIRLMNCRNFHSVMSDFSKTNTNYNDSLVRSFFQSLSFPEPNRFKLRFQTCTKNGCK